jgi:hypothetical protein
MSASTTSIFIGEGWSFMAQKTNLGGGFNPQKIRNRTTLWAVLAGVVALLVFLIIFQVSLYYYYPRISVLPGMYQSGEVTRQIDWRYLGDITSLATFAVIVAGVVFAFINYVQNAVQRKREEAEASFNIYLEMYNKLMDHSAMEARRWVIVNLPTLEEMRNDQKAWLEHIETKLNEIPPGWEGKRPPGREYLKEVLNTFDFIGFVGRYYWNMENELVLWMSSPVAKVWERIHLYVEEEARLRNEPDYYETAREFADYCMAWRRENRPRVTVIKDGT